MTLYPYDLYIYILYVLYIHIYICNVLVRYHNGLSTLHQVLEQEHCIRSNPRHPEPLYDPFWNENILLEYVHAMLLYIYYNPSKEDVAEDNILNKTSYTYTHSPCIR